jgi:tellurite resistance protein TerB
MTSFLDGLTEMFRERRERHRNLPFLKGAMASCALVAVADGTVSFSQRLRMDKIMETLEALQVFDPHEGVNLFNEYVEHILRAPKEGRRKAVAAILAAARDNEAKQLVLRICIAISQADGKISLVEQIEIVSLCSLLGIEPKACGLYTDAEVGEALGIGAQARSDA